MQFMVFLAMVVIGGIVIYIFINGQSHTVTTPDASHAHQQVTNFMDQWTTPARIGAVIAFLIVGWLVHTLWTRLPKGALVALVVLVLLATGVIVAGKGIHP